MGARLEVGRELAEPARPGKGRASGLYGTTAGNPSGGAGIPGPQVLSVLRGTRIATQLRAVRRTAPEPENVEAAMADGDLTRKGTENSLEGQGSNLKGKLKDAAGGLTGDSSLQAEGKMDQLKGKAKDTLGKVQRDLDR
ncbi:MAG TPA: CsbD family protein [Longimicrobiaceae bacterium]|nr:CsbD family protein [Longimicrobiaceae bacterium]